MRQAHEVPQHNYQQNIQAQQQTIRLLTDLVARLDLPPPPHNNHPHNDNQNWENNNNDNREWNNPHDLSWDGGLRVEIFDFSGSLKPEEFLDWMHTVEEIFELKEIPLKKRVTLVTIRYRERAATWWKNFKYHRYLDNLPPLHDRDKLKREMNLEFLPLNYW
jgi:hypothetical protein